MDMRPVWKSLTRWFTMKSARQGHKLSQQSERVTFSFGAPEEEGATKSKSKSGRRRKQPKKNINERGKERRKGRIFIFVLWNWQRRIEEFDYYSCVIHRLWKEGIFFPLIVSTCSSKVQMSLLIFEVEIEKQFSFYILILVLLSHDTSKLLYTYFYFTFFPFYLLFQSCPPSNSQNVDPMNVVNSFCIIKCLEQYTNNDQSN